MNWTLILSIGIPTVLSSAISIIGLWLNYRSTNENIKNEMLKQEINIKNEMLKQEINIKNEILKQKKNIQLDKISDLPFEIIDLFENLRIGGKVNNGKDRISQVVRLVLAYGSEDSINIAVNLQRLISIMDDDSKRTEGNIAKLFSYFFLLFCQIKHDLTEIEINPEWVFRKEHPDLDNLKDSLCEATNKIVSELKLKDFLKIPEPIN